MSCEHGSCPQGDYVLVKTEKEFWRRLELGMELGRKNFSRSSGSFKGEENSIKATEVQKVGLCLEKRKVCNLARKYVMDR